VSSNLIFFLLFQTAFCAFAQSGQAPLQNSNSSALDAEAGNYYYRNYTIKEYKQDFQNWGVVQDKDGVMLFANGNGVMTFDGKAWKLIETPTHSVIRSIAMDHAGKVYVGALDDFGYLKKSDTGGLTFESFLPFLKKQQQGFGNVWSTHVNGEFAWFETEGGLFCWTGERMVFWPWPQAGAWHKGFFWRDKLFVCEEGTGLMRFENDHFELAPGGDAAKNIRIYSALPLANDRLLLATKFDGLFIYDGKEIKPFNTQADTFLKKKLIYTALMLPDSTFAIGTKTAGITILDLQGNVRSMITTENGLKINSVTAMTIDKVGDLWICLDDGISRFEIGTPLRLYAEQMGLQGPPNDMTRYNGKIYVATGLGLFELQRAVFPQRLAFFKKVSTINSSVWDLLEVDNGMLIASNEGLFEMRGSQFKKLDDTPSFSLHRYKGDRSRILVAHDAELLSMKIKNGAWSKAGEIKEVKLDNIRFNETIPGKVWIGTFSQGAALLSFTQPDGSINYDKPSIRMFGPDNGLEEGYIKLNSIDNEELFRVGSGSKHFRFDYATNRFYHDSTFSKRYGFDTHIFPVLNEDASGRFVAKMRKTPDGRKEVIVITRNPSGGYHAQRFNTSRILESTGVFNYEEDGVLWHGGSDGLVRQEYKTDRGDSALFKAFVNKVLLLGDTVFYNGTGGVPQNATFPYSTNSFRFEFTSTNYVADEANVFQYKLEGYDKDWSSWTAENVKEYASMWEGSYRFLVRTRDYGGVISEPAVFSFVISPPWFRSMYAYAAYILIAGFIVWLLIRWRSYKLLKEKEALQAEIVQQTREIRMQNAQLEEQSEELKANAEQLKELDKLKSNFFVNISHEFRTPLSLILSPLEKIMHDNDTSHIHQSDLERMHRNAKRLQQLINQLLDLAKLESGGMKITENRSDLLYFLRVTTASFESMAEIRNIDYSVHIPPGSFDTSFDQDKVETVIYNLLSNAFKFTPDGGRILFRASLDTEMVSIDILDTGPGIPPSEVDKIFDRFYQVDSSSSRDFEGSGIGLSLVKELVQLMKGQVEVESKVGSGTSFKVLLPLKGMYLKTSEVIGQDNEDLATNDNDKVVEAGKEKDALSVNEPVSSEPLILLIEDNEDLRIYLKENLETEYQVVVAENGKVGLEKALELIPDLILSDMMMPQMDGFTLCTKIREDQRTSHIPFILLTARTTIESKLEGLELGADEYMTKPFNIKEIKVRMKNLLEQRKNLRKSFGREVTIQPKNISVTSVDERFLEHALKIMEEHVGDEQFSVERFAEEVGMSRKNLLRKIKALTDQSVNEFIRNFRLNRAAQLLEAKAGTVSEIAYQVGFNNLSYFSKCFKELFGALPNDYAGRKAVINEQ
jgi:signal transduction histidine kinase/DNA-binding response OmpR family regulator